MSNMSRAARYNAELSEDLGFKLSRRLWVQADCLKAVADRCPDSGEPEQYSLTERYLWALQKKMQPVERHPRQIKAMRYSGFLKCAVPDLDSQICVCRLDW